MRAYFLAALLLTTIALPAVAQESNSALASKIERLERDVNFMQKQVYRNKGGDGEITTTGGPVGGNAEVCLTQMAEELRALRGTLEQIQFANRQNAADLKKLQEDVDFRLRAIEEKQNAAAAAAAAAPAPVVAPAPAPAAPAPATPATPAKFDPAPAAAAKPALTGNDFPDANAHYSHAFKLLNDKKYAEASTSFDSFVKKYPTDPLTANAYYWLGESYYARNDFTRSAESFRKGFEANTEGQKAPDNLFKLAKSLSQVKRTNEACIVFAQLTKKYADAAPRIVARADAERATLQCK